MLIKDMTIIILSCDKYSDLWEGQVKLINQNWPDRKCRTLIVTDAVTSKKFENVEIFSTGTDCEWSERLGKAINQINTEFVFLTLDDYYLIKKVDTKRIESIIRMARNLDLDYIRLFKRPTKATLSRIKEYENAFYIDVTHPYSVNLYAGIWKKEFLRYSVRQPLNAWRFEVRLPRVAVEYKAKGAMVNDAYEILDVVRKGKLLRKAAKYFKRNKNIYTGNRAVNTVTDEMKLLVLTFAGRYIPQKFQKSVKNIMKKFGYSFFSEEL